MKIVRHRAQQIFCLTILLTSCTIIRAQEGNKPHQSVMQTDSSTELDVVDTLLDDARQNPTQEVPEVKPVSCVEFWLKKIGTSILVSYIKVKQYIAQQMYGSVDEVSNEKKDSN